MSTKFSLNSLLNLCSLSLSSSLLPFRDLEMRCDFVSFSSFCLFIFDDFEKLKIYWKSIPWKPKLKMKFFIFRYARKSTLFIDDGHQNYSSLEFCLQRFLKRVFHLVSHFPKFLDIFRKKKLWLFKVLLQSA